MDLLQAHISAFFEYVKVIASSAFLTAIVGYIVYAYLHRKKENADTGLSLAQAKNAEAEAELKQVDATSKVVALLRSITEEALKQKEELAAQNEELKKQIAEGQKIIEKNERLNKEYEQKYETLKKEYDKLIADYEILHKKYLKLEEVIAENGIKF